MNNRLIKKTLYQKKFQLGTNLDNLSLFSGRIKLNQKTNIDAYTKSLVKKLDIRKTNYISKTTKIANPTHNKQADTMSNHPQLRWITTDDFCSRHTKYITYANVKKYDRHNSHTYFINVQKDGTFYLHIVVYCDCTTTSQNHIERISDVYSTMEEAKRLVSSHYVKYLNSAEVSISSQCK